jgi:hypothetical protein
MHKKISAVVKIKKIGRIMQNKNIPKIMVHLQSADSKIILY